MYSQIQKLGKQYYYNEFDDSPYKASPINDYQDLKNVRKSLRRRKLKSVHMSKGINMLKNKVS